jgi:drug/metabolite transporter (DMT)-like permease
MYTSKDGTFAPARSGLDPHTLGLWCTLGASCVFGLSTVCTKTGVTHGSVLALLGWRFLLSFTLMTVLVWAGALRIDFRTKPLGGLLAIALSAPGISLLAEAKGLQLTTAAEGGAILALSPIVTLLLSIPVLRERPTARQVLSILVSVAGVLAVILARGLEARFRALGYICLLLCLLSDAMCVLLTRKYSRYTPTERVYMMNLVGAALFVPLALAEYLRAGTVGTLVTLPFRDPAFLTAVLYLGVISSVAGFTLMAIGIRHLGPNRVTPLACLSTVIAVMGAVVFLRESLTPLQGAGTLLILAGAWLASMRSRSVAGGGHRQLFVDGV